MSIASVFFVLIASMVGLSAIMVVITQNIVRAAVWLLFTLVGVAVLYFLLGSDFVGATQLIVYVGGTLVLVVFGVMLTAQGPFVTMKTSPAEWAVGAVVGLMFLGVLISATANVNFPNDPKPISASDSNTTATLGYAFLGIPDATPSANISGMPPGTANSARTQIAYLLPFEIVSIHLLVVLIGAAYLARAKRRPRPVE